MYLLDPTEMRKDAAWRAEQAYQAELSVYNAKVQAFKDATYRKREAELMRQGGYAISWQTTQYIQGYVKLPRDLKYPPRKKKHDPEAI